METTEWSLMRRGNKKQPQGLKEPGIDEHSSPAIQILIESLDRDLEESQRNATKTQKSKSSPRVHPQLLTPKTFCLRLRD